MGRRSVVLATGACLVVLALAAVLALHATGRWLGSDRSALEGAVRLAPSGSERYTWTDWDGVRDELGLSLDGESTAKQVRRLLDRGFEEDLTSASGLLDSAELLHSEYGWSPATASWELLAQSPDGAVELVRLPDGTDFDALADRLRELGYPEPSEDDGVWAGGDTLLGQITLAAGLDGSPTLADIVLDADRGLVLASDSSEYLSEVAGGLGEHDSDVDAVVAALGDDPVSAVAYTGDYACKALAMAGADDDAQAEADELLADAGRVDPLAGFAMATFPAGDDANDDANDARPARVAMSFATKEQARRNATSRAALAAGAAPGQGGSFADRFALGRVAADGDVVTMQLRARPGSYLLSDLSSGPLLFATC